MTDKKPKTCSICGLPHYAKELCKKHYYQRPEVKAHTKAYMKAYTKAYYQRPEVRAHTKAYMKAYTKAYYQRPEVRAHTKAYMKAYTKAYYQRPEVRAYRKDKTQKKQMVREYQALMLLKKPSRLAMLRLEALAELLGRDLEEWRTENQKEVWV